MRSVVASVALAVLAVACGDDDSKTAAGPGQPDASMLATLDGGAGPMGSDGSVQPGLTGDAGGWQSAQGDAAVELNDVCSGKDSFEPNDSKMNATALVLAADSTAALGAGITSSDDDWYTFTAPESEPATVTVDYAVNPGSNAHLSLSIYDATQRTLAYKNPDRTGRSQTLSAVVETAASGAFFIKVSNATHDCAPYTLHVNALSCTDSYEDNDTASTATPVALDTMHKATLTANVSGHDDDFYQVIATKGDPMQITATYTRPPNDSVDLTLNVQDGTGSTVAVDSASRSTASETMSALFQAKANGIYRFSVRSARGGDTTDACAAYDAAVNAAFCTDSFEDNDTNKTPVALGAGTQSATVMQADDDYYLTPAGAASCSLQWTLTPDSAQSVRLAIFDATDSLGGWDDSDTTLGAQTLEVMMPSGRTPKYIRVSANRAECTPYTVSCQ